MKVSTATETHTFCSLLAEVFAQFHHFLMAGMSYALNIVCLLLHRSLAASVKTGKLASAQLLSSEGQFGQSVVGHLSLATDRPEAAAVAR